MTSTATPPRHRRGALCSLILLAACGHSDPSPPEPAATTPPSPHALQHAFRQCLDDHLQVTRQRGARLPGATAAFVLPDAPVFSCASGLADQETGSPMRPDTRMPSGSIGKMFVAALVVDLSLSGALDLDAPVARTLGDQPWFDRLPNHGTLTLRHLLNHSAGWIDHVFDDASTFATDFREHLRQGTATRDVAPTELLAYILDSAPLAPAGAHFHYTDTGYILAGLVLESATDTPFEQLLTHRLLEPLKLRHTTPFATRHHPDLAAGYSPAGQRLFGLPMKVATAGELCFSPTVEWTGGGLLTTSADLARWARDLFEGRAISAAGVEQMLSSMATPSRRDRADRPLGYGLGVSIVATAHGTAFRHGGFFPGYQSLLAWFPDCRVAIALQVNADDVDIEPLFDALSDLLLDARG